MAKKALLIGAKLVAVVVVISAYQGTIDTFDSRKAIYDFIMCLLMTYYSWGDRVSRLIMICLSALCVNNLFDELFGEPTEFSMSEFIFGILVAIIFIYQTYRLWTTRHIK